MSWIRVNRDKPCPICGRPDWCSVAQDGSVVCCQRVPSDWVCKGQSGGYIHKLHPDIKRRVKNVFRKAPKKKTLPAKYWHAQFERSVDGAKTVGPYVLSRELGVSVDSLDRLMCGWSMEHKAWTFPMWDGDGRMVGFRLRNQSGQKWCMKGSRNGIFWPLDVSNLGDSPLFICEGPTDCAALLDLKFHAIGRPNALGGVNYLTTFLRGAKREVVIVADNDVKTGVGIDGAVRLAHEIESLCMSVAVLQPPSEYKDIRAWYKAGGTRADLLEWLRS